MTAKNFFIYKKQYENGPYSIDEFRPISATSLFYKILEIILKNRIDRFEKEGKIKSLHLA